MTGEGREVQDRVFYGLALALTLAALALRLYRLDHQELWVDESYLYVQTLYSDFLRGLAFDLHPPLFGLVQKLARTFFGPSVWAFRLPAAIFGTLAVPAAIWFTRLLFGNLAGLFAGLFLALSPLAVYYSQTARGYSLLLLLLFIAYAQLLIALREGGRIHWRLFGVASGAALLTHYLALLGLAPTLLYVLFLSGQNARKANLLVYARVSAAALLPASLWLALSFGVLGFTPASADFYRELWEGRSLWTALPLSLETFLHHTDFPLWKNQLASIEVGPALRVYGLGALAVAALLFATAGAEGDRGGNNRKKLVAAGHLFLPLLILLTFSLVKNVYMVSRYDLVAFPGFLAIVGLALARPAELRGRAALPASLLVATLLLFPAVNVLARYAMAPVQFDSYRKFNDAGASFAAKKLGEGGVAVFFGYRSSFIVPKLTMAGWKCDENGCASPEGGAAFSYHTYPYPKERTVTASYPFKEVPTPERASAWVEDLFATLGGAPQKLTVFIDAFSYRSEGALKLPNCDITLLDALTRRGYRATTFEPQSGAAEFAYGPPAPD